MTLDDETRVTELMIAPDGRIYAFGLSDRVAELLARLAPHELSLHQRIAAIPTSNEAATATTTTRHSQPGE